MKASIITGPLPERHSSNAHVVAARQASTSLPSTRIPGKPYPAARSYSGIRAIRWIDSEIAHWLFWQ